MQKNQDSRAAVQATLTLRTWLLPLLLSGKKELLLQGSHALDSSLTERIHIRLIYNYMWHHALSSPLLLNSVAFCTMSPFRTKRQGQRDAYLAAACTFRVRWYETWKGLEDSDLPPSHYVKFLCSRKLRREFYKFYFIHYQHAAVPWSTRHRGIQF